MVPTRRGQRRTIQRWHQTDGPSSDRINGRYARNHINGGWQRSLRVVSFQVVDVPDALDGGGDQRSRRERPSDPAPRHDSWEPLTGRDARFQACPASKGGPRCSRQALASVSLATRSVSIRMPQRGPRGGRKED